MQIDPNFKVLQPLTSFKKTVIELWISCREKKINKLDFGLKKKNRGPTDW